MTNTRNYYNHFLKASEKINAFFALPTENLPLSKNESNLLKMLCFAYGEGEKLISAQIAQKLGVTRSAVSQMIDKLEGVQYVKRTASPHDKKIAYIDISPAVKIFYEQEVEKKCNCLYNVFAKMGEDNAKKLLELTEVFTKALQDEQTKIL